MKSKIITLLILLIIFPTQAIANEQQLELAKSHIEQMKQYDKEEQFEKAIYYAKKALEIRIDVLGVRHRDTLLLANDLALIYRKSDQFNKALNLFKDIYRICKEEFGKKDPLTITVMSNLALVYQDLGQLKIALSLFEDVYHLREKYLGEQHENTLLSINNLGILYKDLGELKKALHLLEKAEMLSKHFGKKHKRRLIITNNLANVYSDLGMYNQALSLLDNNYKLYKEVEGDYTDKIRSINNLAHVYNNLGQMKKALALYEEGYYLAKKKFGEKHSLTLLLMGNLSLVYHNLGRLSEALILSEKCYQLTVNVFGENNLKTIIPRNNLSQIYVKLKRFSESLYLLETNYKISKEKLTEKHSLTLNNLNNLAEANNKLGKLSKAFDLRNKIYSISLELFGEQHPETLLYLNNLAQTYLDLDNFSKALPLFEKGYRISKEVLSKQHLLTLTLMNNLAGTYKQLKRFNEALSLYKDCYHISKSVLGGNHPKTLLCLSNLAYFYKNQNNIEEAIKHFEKLVTRIEDLRTQNLSAENRQLIFKEWIDEYFNLSRLYINTDVFDAFRIAEMSKSRTLLESLETKQANQKLPATDKEQFEKYNHRLAEFNKFIALAVENNHLELKSFLEKLKKELLNKRQKLIKHPSISILDAREGVEYIPDNAVFISYFIINDNEVLAFALDSERIRVNYLEFIPNLKENIETYRRQLQIFQRQTQKSKRILRPNRRSLKFLSRKLSQQLLEPLKEYLQNKPHWIISPSASLSFIPFETLHFNGKQVIANHDVSYVQSLSVLKILHQREQQYQNIQNRGTLLAMGAPLYDSISINTNNEMLRESLKQRGIDKWQNLPGSLQEINNLEQLFKYDSVRIYKQNAATEATLQKLNKQGILAKYRYLVFSSHGLLNTQIPELSAIVLGQVNNPAGIDGYVTASEWAAYNLKSDLMVLSACQTGEGKFISGEGVMGLPYALYVAGNKNTLFTLWSISDQITVEFVTSFFSKLKAGVEQIKALAATKREFIKKGGRYSNPKYWAAFVLYGN
jgi:CHAT domain-containing protein